MAAPQVIQDLIERFERNRDDYVAGRYNETQLRREFIDPFFKALGWDVDNEQGYAEAYKDVIHEDAIKIGSATKAPDYCFRIGGTRKFFLEAKKPSVDIKGDPGPAYQLRRYAWSAKLPLSILSDFEEFAVYDCRVRPAVGDKSTTARVMYLTYTEYAEKWDEIAARFSRDAVMKGSFDKYAESSRLKKGTSQVDDAFLAEIESWRDELAHNIALRNPKLSGRELNFAVQITIDRIIFLRICEDRGIERYGELQGLMNGQDVYARLLVLFRKADDRYNSGLFHFSQEKDRPEAPDELTPTLVIDDKVLKDIFKRLYYPESPYEFSALPAEILGQVYEQFLGKVITLTAGHRARVEDKPEVKKAGGVFYTPAYIVDYIVQNTVGKLVEGKTPKEVEKIKILDPACGSGSFLLGAYQFLLDWHLRWYLENEPEHWAKGKNPPICFSQEYKNLRTQEPKNAGIQETGKKAKGKGQNCGVGDADGLDEQIPSSQRVRSDGARGRTGYKLTLGERKKILLNNLFGVDIDSQAVEVTKLSLLLKVLEGQKDLSLFARERALPDLGQNIKCGNSLIGPDFYEKGQMMMFDEEEKYKINAFDWQAEFKAIFARKNGGFDAVIGNPPYGGVITKEQQMYYDLCYKYSTGSKDLYLLFLEKYYYLLKDSGLLGVIISNTWLQSITYNSIRKYLSNSYKWLKFLHIPEKIFKAVVDTHVLIFLKEQFNSKEKTTSSFEVDILQEKRPRYSHTLLQKEIPTDGSSINIVASDKHQKLFRKIESLSVPLAKMCTVYNGVKPFEKGKGNPPQTEAIMKEQPFVKEGKCPGVKWSPLLRGSLIHRYINLWNEDYWILYGPWLAAPRESEIFSQPFKIMVRQTSDSLIATIIESGFIARNNLHIIISKDKANLSFLLGLINSKLMNYTYSIMNPERGEALAEVKKRHVELLPIRTVDFTNKQEKGLHDKLVSLVEVMLDLHKKLSVAKTPHDRTMLERQIAATDGQIDRLVYELYGLTDEEIKLVEGGEN
jgi:predicted type IV restriction endonuclease